jgi:uncharacterized Fe-S cluster protein YjdI
MARVCFHVTFCERGNADTLQSLNIRPHIDPRGRDGVDYEP